MKIELHDKEGDKNISLHFFSDMRRHRNEVRNLVYEIHHNIAECFLQGDDGEGWMMIEFWTNDMDKIFEAVEYVEKKFKVTVE